MISIVTITYNNYDDLVKTVRSVAPIKDQVQHIIVNGGKCEKTAEFLKDFDGVSLSEPDRGISDAFNKGVKLASGDGIVFLNSGDILIQPNYIEWADNQLKSVDFTYADAMFEDQIGGVIRLRPHGQALGRGMPFPHQTVIARKEVFAAVGPFDLNLKTAMCFDFACKMEKAGMTGAYFPQPVVHNDGSGISASKENVTIAESKRALEQNGLWNTTNRIYFFKRVTLYKIRSLLQALGLRGVLKFLKRTIRR